MHGGIVGECNTISVLASRRGKGGSIPCEKSLITYLNPYSYLLIRKQIGIIEDFNVVNYDGFLLSWLMRLIGIKQNRISFDMTSFAPVFFDCLVKRRCNVFFVGGEPGIADKAVSKLKDNYPSLIVSGIRHGFFSGPEERNNFINRLVLLSPDYVVVGMGAPLQEQFLVDLKKAGWNGVGYTCGGFLHQTAKAGVCYYPPIINRLNLRWLYRMVDEPKLMKRYFLEYPKFILFFLWDVINYRMKS